MSTFKIRLVFFRELVEEIKCPRESSQALKKELLLNINNAIRDVDTNHVNVDEIEKSITALGLLIKYQSTKEDANAMDQATNEYVNVMDQITKDVVNK